MPYSQPMPNMHVAGPPIDLTKDDESSPMAAPSSSKIEPEEDIYSALTEASEDSDWSRLSTPEGDDEFVVVEHGALPIRSARTGE
jgi:hypothetical protein